MAIKLEVQPYCGACLDFEADVIKPNKVYSGEEIILGDTVVRCEHARRCENIRKYLMRLEKERLNY